MKHYGMIKAACLETYTTATATIVGSDVLAQELVCLCCGNAGSTDCCYFVEISWGQEVSEQLRLFCSGESRGSENQGGKIGEPWESGVPRVRVGMSNCQNTCSTFPSWKFLRVPAVQHRHWQTTGKGWQVIMWFTEEGAQRHTPEVFWEGVSGNFCTVCAGKDSASK